MLGRTPTERHAYRGSSRSPQRRLPPRRCIGALGEGEKCRAILRWTLDLGWDASHVSGRHAYGSWRAPTAEPRRRSALPHRKKARTRPVAL